MHDWNWWSFWAGVMAASVIWNLGYYYMRVKEHD
jgi:hypothetical protein